MLNLPPPPLTTADLGFNPEEVPIEPPEELQLACDAINVVEGRVPLSSFPPDYQNKIKTFYQFSATRYTTDQPIIARRIRETLDIV